jgi:hypothetical protein
MLEGRIGPDACRLGHLKVTAEPRGSSPRKPQIVRLSRSALSAHPRAADGRSRRISLKNSNFQVDHNSEGRWQPQRKVSLGVRRTNRFCRCNAPVCLAVSTSGPMNAIRAKTRISPWLSFRVFQRYRRSADSEHRNGGRCSWEKHLRSVRRRAAGHPSGSPALRSPSAMRAYCALKVGSSEKCMPNHVCTVKPG